MKILFDVSQVRTGGGVQTALALLSNVIKHKPFQFKVVCSFELAREMKDHDLYNPQFMTELPECIGSVNRLRQPRKFLPDLEKDYQPDLVYTLFGPAYWTAQARHVVGFAMAHYIYPEYRPAHDKGFLKRFAAGLLYDFQGKIRVSGFKKAPYLVAETETVKKRLGDVLGFDPSRVFVIRNCYSPQFKDNLQDVEAPSDPDRVRRIFVPSSYYPHKNLEIIPAIAAWLKQRLSFSFQFVFTLDDASWTPLQERARAQGVTEAMTSVGKIPNRDIARMYQSSDMVFLPTLLECSTAVYPESFMSRRPVVTSSLDFARELCGEAALYCDPHSPEDCGDNIQRVLEDEGLRNRFVEAGDRQLQEAYPNPEEKWRAQLSLIRSLTQVP